jgi:hypothetical protein
MSLTPYAPSDVSDDFYNLEKWVARLRALEAATQDSPTEAQFRKVEEEVLQDQYVELARGIVEKRQRYAAAQQNKYEFELDRHMLDTLATQGSVTFNLVEDLKRGNFGMVEWRIIDVTLDTFDVGTEASSLSLNIDLMHSGTSILRGVDGTYWFFQQRREDPPISWGFVYNHGRSGVSKNTSLAKDSDETLSTALIGEQANFRDYWPSMFSDLTLTINRGQARPVEQVKAIKAVKMTVHYAVR